MKELFETFLPSWAMEYVHIPYMFAVWLIVEWLRYQVDGLDNKVKPKHLTVIVGLLLGVALHLGEKYIEGVEIPVHVLGVSFLVTTWIHDYGIKILKEKIPFLKSITDKQEK